MAVIDPQYLSYGRHHCNNGGSVNVTEFEGYKKEDDGEEVK
jgi:hypothetical protein